MPELRYNIASRDWVIIATERAKRPEEFSKKPPAAVNESAANCPFCPGREKKTPPEIYAIRDPGTLPDTPGWKVRVTQNAFPALQPEGELERRKDAQGFTKMNGIGKHEVIIESPDHEAVIATMEQTQVEEIFLAYRQRYAALARDPRFESVILFKNHGQGAGTSLHHPHSQIIGTPVIPQMIRSRLDIARLHFDEEGTCLYCDFIKMEKGAGERILFETDNYIAFVCYAPRMPFETWVVPKYHNSNFEEITIEQSKELALVMKKVLEKLYKALNNPDFNYAFYPAPTRDKNLEFFHWNIKIFPRITSLAGFEVGSGISIVTVVPETAAEFLRKA